MTFRGIIFDLDGTLIDSLDDLADSMNGVLSQFRFPQHDLIAYKSFIGRGIRNLVKAALPENRRNEETLDKCYKLMLEIYAENCIDKTKPYPGILELLDELKSRHLKLAVFSNKADALTKKIVPSLLPGYFDEVMGLILEANRKPNPAGAWDICKKWSLAPKEIIYVGDSNVDMQTAQNAGMFGVGVLWGYRDGQELMANGAELVIRQPLELLSIL